MSYKLFNAFIVVTFVCSLVTPVPKAHAGNLLGLPEPGTMVNLSPAYEPMLIKGLKIHPENPFLFDFIIDTGHDRYQESLKPEITKLIKYFLTAMTVPEKDLWVNLSPFEKDRMIASNLAQTEMGKDMLAQDYILKQLTASLIYPEKDLGRSFWDEIYTKARQLYGTTQIPVDTFNKVWIVADTADVYERDHTAYVVRAHLKVMLEEDYVALSRHSNHENNKTDVSHSLGAQVVREVILPEIEKEVNSGKNFTSLRQMFYSMILASWYKMALKNAILTRIYGNQSKVKVGVNQDDPKINDEIFNRYLRAYKKGVFNYIKEDMDKSSGETIPRKYFSGGEAIWQSIRPRVVHEANAAMLGSTNHMVIATVDTFLVIPTNQSMISSGDGFHHLIIKGQRRGEAAHPYFESSGIVANKKINQILASEIADLVNEYKDHGVLIKLEFNKSVFDVNSAHMILFLGITEGAMVRLRILGANPVKAGQIIRRIGAILTNDAMGTTPGGIDFNFQKMQMSIQKDGQGVGMGVDSAMIGRIKTEGFAGLDFEIESIVPTPDLPVLLGLESDKKGEQLAGV